MYLLFKMATTIPSLEKVAFSQLFRNRSLSNITMSHVIRDLGLGTKHMKCQITFENFLGKCHGGDEHTISYRSTKVVL